MPWLRSLVLVLWCVTGTSAADWPQWLGPNRDASSPEVVAPWKKAPPVLWRQAVGEGHSSPVVADGRVFLHALVKNKNEEEVSAFDAQSGKLLWRSSYARDPFKSIFGNGPRATPAVVGERVYTFGVTGILSCWNAKTGAKVWQIDTLKEFKAANLTFGVACSPLVDDGRVLVNVGGKGASVVAFDAEKGTVVWKSQDDRASYSSPILTGQGKERQAIFLTQLGLLGLDPANGKEFWRFPLVDLLSESSTTPALAGDLLLAGSVTYGSAGLQLGVKNEKPTAKELWRNRALTCYFSTPVAIDADHFYLVTGTIIPPPQATLRCIEAKTGKEMWNKPKIGKYHASLLRTGDGKLLLLTDGGVLALLDPDPKGYKELVRTQVCRDTWAHPALAQGLLYIRDSQELLCLQTRP